MKHVVLGLSSWILLAGCATPPVSIDDPSRAQFGSVIGTIRPNPIDPHAPKHDLKAVIFPDRPSDMNIVSGREYLQRYQEALTPLMLESSVMILDEENHLRVRLSEELLFAPESIVVKSSAHASINTLADVMLRYPQTNLKIEGYTDDVGYDASRLEESKARARAVYELLIALGISSTRLSYEGYGKANPITTNITTADRETNRRVEILITPNPTQIR